MDAGEDPWVDCLSRNALSDSCSSNLKLYNFEQYILSTAYQLKVRFELHSLG